MLGHLDYDQLRVIEAKLFATIRDKYPHLLSEVSSRIITRRIVIKLTAEKIMALNSLNLSALALAEIIGCVASTNNFTVNDHGRRVFTGNTALLAWDERWRLAVIIKHCS
ncbi:MAG: hypothetical protein WC052_05605 [Patescibacteria group bacterium]